TFLCRATRGPRSQRATPAQARSHATSPRADTRNRACWVRSTAVPAVPCGVRTQRTQEVHPTERGPVSLAEPELGVYRLPQHKPGQPLLTRGTNQQVRIRLPRGVEVLRDVIDGEHIGQLVDTG